MKKIFLAALLSLFCCDAIYSQSSNDSLQSVKSNYLKVFLSGYIFNGDYIRQHITFVNYVRDRFEADVHLLFTVQSAGSGGTEYTLFYYGQHSFTGKNDTLKYI